MPQSFADLKVSPELRKALDRLGFEEPSPAQAALFTAIRDQRSVVIAAPPVSGRGVAVAGAALELADASVRHPQVLVLASTRDRVLKLTGAVSALAAGRKGLRCVPFYAGQSADRQAALLAEKPQIAVATPGRLREVIEAGALKGEGVTAVLLDAADDLLEAGFAEDIEAVLAATPATRLIAALATFISPDLEALAGEFCPNADRVVVPPAGPAPVLTWYDVEAGHKLAALTLLADRHVVHRGLVFTNSRLTAEELADRLTAVGYPAEPMFGEATAAARERALKKFRTGALTFLVATDAGLRELETEPADVIVHFDWPLEDSVLGVRQAGLRRGGQAFALASGREIIRARAFTRRGSPARLGRLPLLGEVPEARLHANVARLRETLASRNPAACRTIVDVLVAEGFEPAVVAGAAIRLLGNPELPPQPVPAPLPHPPPPSVPPPVAAPMPEAVVSPVAEDQADWSPGVSPAPESGESPESPAPEYGVAAGDETGGYMSENGYVITDNASEDGVVYPPGANFGDDVSPESGGYADSGYANSRRGPRRERGGRGRGMGGGRGGDGGPTAAGMRRLWLNVGRMDRIQPRDIVGCILGETGLPSVAVGRVQLFERHALVDVSGSFESQILEALNRAAVRGRKLKAKIAAY
jgi:ATP-dependent RNA helicase DeaD